MNIYPTLVIEYNTALSTEEVIDRIKNRIETNNILVGSWFSDIKYTGIVIKNKFLIRNQISGIVWANPDIKGIVESQNFGCKITLISSPNLFTKMFMGAWLVFAGFAGIFLTINAIIKREFSWAVLIPFAFFAIGYGLMWVGVVFGTESDDEIIFDLLGADSQLDIKE